MKKFKIYLTYHLRWQLGAIVTIPCIYLFVDYLKLNYWIATILFQFVGATVFFPIDTYIFKKKNEQSNLTKNN